MKYQYFKYQDIHVRRRIEPDSNDYDKDMFDKYVPRIGEWDFWSFVKKTWWTNPKEFVPIKEEDLFLEII